MGRDRETRIYGRREEGENRKGRGGSVIETDTWTDGERISAWRDRDRMAGGVCP